MFFYVKWLIHSKYLEKEENASFDTWAIECT